MAPTAVRSTPAQPEKKEATISQPLKEQPGTPPAKPAESLEMRVGSYWLVRIGVAVLLTGLVFFATYLYQTITPRLGPPGKVGLLYLASFALLGLGAWLTRRSTEPRMKNFASVVEAGGLAAVFFTTYAAHYFEGLKIISQPAVAGALLLLWTAFIVWLASRRESPSLATGAILLMGYTTAVHPVGVFGLWANLVITVAGLYLFWRHRWSLVSIAALAATYGGYFYWRFYEQATLADRGEFRVQLVFLSIYWALYALAGFLGTEKEVPPRNRGFLVGLNNSAFFAVATLLIVESHRASFWMFAAAFGTALVILGVLCHRRVDAATAGVYRMQGLLLITTAIVTYFSGWQLGLMLALQTAVLSSAASWRCSRVLLLAAILAGVIATYMSFAFVVNHPAGLVLLPVGLTGFFLLLAAWVAQHRPRGETPELYPKWFEFAAAIFSLAGPTVWFVAMWLQATTPVLPAALAVVAVVLTVTAGFHRLPILPVLGQIWFAASILNWFIRHGETHLTNAFAHRAPWWSSGTLILAGLVLGRWWRSPSASALLKVGATACLAMRAMAALGAVLILSAAVWPCCSAEMWLIVAPVVAVAVFAAAWLLRDEILGFAAQLPLLASCGALILSRLAPPLPRPAFALFAALAPLVIALVGGRVAGKLENPFKSTAIAHGNFYQVLSVGLVGLWIFDYLPAAWRPLALAASAVAVFLGNRAGARLLPFFFVALGTASLATFLVSLRINEISNPQSLAAIVLLALPFEWTRRKGPHDEIPSGGNRVFCLLAIAFAGWAWVTAGHLNSGGFVLVTAWTLYATVLLAVGGATRERVYQSAGFAVLAASLLHVAIFDLWLHETPAYLPPALALAAVALTFSATYIRLTGYTAMGPLCFVAAVVAWGVRHGSFYLDDAWARRSPWWSALTIIASALVIGRWWKVKSGFENAIGQYRDEILVRAIAAVGGVLVLCAWTRPLVTMELWQLVAPLIALAIVAGAWRLRDGVLALAAQIPLLAACFVYISGRAGGSFPSSYFALVPALSPMLVAILAPRLSGKFDPDEKMPITGVALVYEMFSVGLMVLWIFDFLPRTWQPFALAAVGLGFFALTQLEIKVQKFVYPLLGVAALLAFWFTENAAGRGVIQNLAAIIMLALPFEWARRKGAENDLPGAPIRTVCLALLALTGWRWVSSGHWEGSGFYVAAAWAIYAAFLLGIGLATRERVYRLAGFAILAATLIRVTVFDAWSLSVPYRMVSFMVLGAVLMSVGFLYNRYQDKLKEWL